MSPRTLAALTFCAVARARSIRIVTYNIHGWRDAEHVDNFDRIVNLLKSLDADIICLNEVLHPFVAPAADDPYWDAVRERHGHAYPPPAGSRPDEADEHCYMRRLAAALHMPHWAFGAAVGEDDEPQPFASTFFAQYPFGNAILTRFELADVRRVLLPVFPPDLTLGDQPRTPQDLEHRQLTMARVRLPGGGVIGVASTHLDHKAEPLRVRQAERVAVHCRAAFDETLPWILCGDLNSFDRRDMSGEQWAALEALCVRRGWSPPRADSLVLKVLRAAGCGDSFAAIEPTAGERALPPPTCWTGARLDYIMLSRAARSGCAELRVTAHETIECDHSDHKPVVCDLEVPDTLPLQWPPR